MVRRNEIIDELQIAVFVYNEADDGIIRTLNGNLMIVKVDSLILRLCEGRCEEHWYLF